MDKKVTIRVKTVYGVVRGYAVNEEAKLFAELILPRKTFNSHDVEIMQKLGFEIEVDIEAVKVEEAIK